MNDQERQIISDIFARLEQTAGQQRDPEAERFIADKLRTQPYAPYAMAQALYVQEEAMKSLNAQLEQAKAENQRLSQAGSGGGSFLSSIFGGGAKPQQPSSQQPSGASFSRPGPAPQNYPPQQGGPWGAAPQQGGYPPQGGYAPQGGGFAQPQAAAGGGFLKGALTTAAGVAGGMVVGNALMNAFSGGHHGALGSFSNADMASMGGGDTIIENNYYGSPEGGGGFGDAGFDQGGMDQGGFDGGSGGYQDASFDTGGDLGGGGGDDSSWT